MQAQIDEMSLEEFDFEEILEESYKTFQTIHLQSLEEQAQYADPELKKAVLQKEICREKAKNLWIVPFNQWTTTEVGNMAYYALHSPVDREEFEKVLREYREYRTYAKLQKPVQQGMEEWGYALLELIREVLFGSSLKI